MLEFCPNFSPDIELKATDAESLVFFISSEK